MNYSLTGSRGTFAVSGSAAALSQSARTFAAFIVNGQPASLEYARIFAAAAGSFALSGFSSTGTRLLSAAAGSFALSARPATLFPSLAPRAFSASFAAAGMRAYRLLGFAAGSLSLTGNAASLVRGRGLRLQPGSFALSGLGAWFDPPFFAGASGSFVLAGSAATLLRITSTRTYRKQTTIDWPEDLLGCPLRAGYTGTVAPMFERTTISEAPPSFFRYKVDERRDYRVEFIWSLSQLSAFETFFNDDLNRGMRWFMMKHIADIPQRALYCHISEPYTITPQADRPDLYRIAFAVTGFWRVARSPDWS